MKHLLIVILLTTIIGSKYTNAGTITVYGRNEGTVVTTTTQLNATTTTTAINCDNSISRICYTTTSIMSPIGGSGIYSSYDYVQLISNDPKGTIIKEGYMVDYSQSKINDHETAYSISLVQENK